MKSSDLPPGLVWKKSSRSKGANDCVEVARRGRWVYIRDSKDPDGDVIVLPYKNFPRCLVGPPPEPDVS